MRLRRSIWLVLILLTFLIIPSVSLAENGSIESFLPDESPIKTDSEPIYLKYNPAAYQLDSEKGIGVFGFGTGAFEQLSNAITQLGNVGALLTIYVLQFFFTRFYSENLNAAVGKWTLGIRDHLFIGEFMAAGLVILVIVLVFSLGRREVFAQKVKLFLQLFLISTILLSFATPILNFMDRTERLVSDTLFWVYLAADPNSKKNVPKPEDDGEKFGQARDQALINISSQFWENFRLAPWQMAEFGAVPKPEMDKNGNFVLDKKGNPVYKGRDKEIHEDTHKILSLNPLIPDQFIKREKLVAEWTNNSIWGMYGQKLYNTMFTVVSPLAPTTSDVVTGAKTIADEAWDLTVGGLKWLFRIDSGDEKDKEKKEKSKNEEEDKYEEIKYPSMTSGNTIMRFITVFGTFIVGTAYGCALLFIAGIGMALKFVNVILYAMVGFLLFTMFIPNWGWQVMTRWAQYFLITSLYKIIVSVLLVVILFVSSLINTAVSPGLFGIGVYQFAHLAFGLALFIGIKLLWDILMIPARVINETGAILRNTAKKGAEIGLGTVLLAGRGAAAAVTGNPAFLAAGWKGFLFQNKNKGSGTQGKGAKSSLKNQDASFIPEGFSVKSSKAKDFATDVLPNLQNPYQKDSDEAKVFDDMKEKGLNPYARDDRKIYEKEHLQKEHSEAFSNIKGDAREFLTRSVKQTHQKHRNERLQRINEMAQRQRAKKQQQEKKPSRLRRAINYFKDKSWGRR